MALQVNTPYETSFGITLDSTYWRWVGLGIDVPGSQANGMLYAYASEDAFNTGKQPVGQRQYPLSGAEFGALVMQPPTGNTLSDVLSNAVYDYVRATDPFFANAVSTGQ